MKQLDIKTLLREETLYSTANGYVGMRANFEEAYPVGYPTIRGTYINGFHAVIDVKYGEANYGFPRTAQTLTNLVDAQTIRVGIDGEMFSVFTGTLINISRGLNIEKGYAWRKVDWISPKGHHLIFNIKRLASFDKVELMLISYSVTSVNYSGDLTFESTIKSDISNFVDKEDPRVSAIHNKLLHVNDGLVKDDWMAASAIAERSNLEMAVVVTHNLTMDYTVNGAITMGKTTVSIAPNKTVSLDKFCAYTDSLRHKDLINTSKTIAFDAKKQGASHWFNRQKTILEGFWSHSNVKVQGDDKVDIALKYNVYQLFASAPKDQYCSVAAKGLSGEGYEGHYFWDTEIYALPFFMLTNPDIAKNILMFRYNTLEKARERARMMGHKRGAKIPWRTISGSECSGYFPAGAAQYHINADIAYAVMQYYLFTKDDEFMENYGFELLAETALLWLQVGHYNAKNQFCIDAVTGPDEYTALINNNYFTNAMAQYHLKNTTEFAIEFKGNKASAFNSVCKKIGLTQNDLDAFKKAAEHMKLPYDEALNINIQDDSFLSKGSWDFANTKAEEYPLLTHFHPLTIYRYKVLKQADTVLAHMLLDEPAEDIMAASYAYYEPLTTHDSSLSPCVYGMMASRLNMPKKAYDYFMQTIRLDLDDLNGNTRDGLHLANAGGAYMSIVYGFGGLRIKQDGVHLNPTKPDEWQTIMFSFWYKSAVVKVTIGQRLTIAVSAPVELIIKGKSVRIKDMLTMDY